MRETKLDADNKICEREREKQAFILPHNNKTTSAIYFNAF